MEIETKICFIVNPNAGVRKNKIIINVIKNWCIKNKIVFDIYVSEYKKHAVFIAKEACSKDYTTIVAVGGDGTVNEVVCGMIDSNKTLGIIPCGSGNGLARHLGIPLDINKALNLIQRGTATPIDIMNINDQYSINISGIGFDALVAYKFSLMKKRGLKNYIKSTFIEFKNSKEISLEIRENENYISINTWILSICNSSQYGNNFYIANHASCDDGLIDFIFIKKPTLKELPYLLYLILSKKANQSKLVKIIRANFLEIKIKGVQKIHIDGETSSAQNKLTCCINKQINIIA